MQKIQILLDEGKLERERRYSPAKVRGAVDEVLCGRHGFRKAEDGFYLGTGSPGDFAGFMSAVMTLKGQPWFTENVDTWLWFNSDDSEDPDDFAVEDVKLHYAI